MSFEGGKEEGMGERGDGGGNDWDWRAARKSWEESRVRVFEEEAIWIWIWIWKMIDEK